MSHVQFLRSIIGLMVLMILFAHEAGAYAAIAMDIAGEAASIADEVAILIEAAE